METKERKAMEDKMAGVHLSHCYQGENPDNCKYGDNDCPAKPKWIDTVMSDKQMIEIQNNSKSAFNELLVIDTTAKAQTEIIGDIAYKAGMKTVAEFANQFAGIKHNPEWIANLKELGL